MPSPRELSQEIPTHQAKVMIQKPKVGANFLVQIPGDAREGMVMAKIETSIACI